MACIDKLYCYSKKEFVEFYNWCVKYDYLCQKHTQTSLLDYFYTTPITFDTDFEYYTSSIPVACFRSTQDMWLLYHCPIKWVRCYLLTYQYPNIHLKIKKIELYI